MPTPLFEPSAALDIYNDFRVILSETSGRTQAALVRESGGGPSIVDPVDIAITEGDLRDALDAIHPADQQGPSRRGPQTVIDPIKDVGARLFNSLFRGTLGHAYSEALSIAESTGKRLRVAIRVEDDSHRLSDLPWEFLFDPIRNDFLALSRRSILIREVSARPMLER